VTLEQAVDPEKTAEELLGELAHQLSLLVRSELEVAAAERGPWLHRIAIELAASLGAAVAMLLALGAASFAAVEGLRLVLRGGSRLSRSRWSGVASRRASCGSITLAGSGVA